MQTISVYSSRDLGSKSAEIAYAARELSRSWGLQDRLILTRPISYRNLHEHSEKMNRNRVTSNAEVQCLPKEMGYFPKLFALIQYRLHRLKIPGVFWPIAALLPLRQRQQRKSFGIFSKSLMHSVIAAALHWPICLHRSQPFQPSSLARWKRKTVVQSIHQI